MSFLAMELQIVLSIVTAEALPEPFLINIHEMTNARLSPAFNYLIQVKTTIFLHYNLADIIIRNLKAAAGKDGWFSPLLNYPVSWERLLINIRKFRWMFAATRLYQTPLRLLPAFRAEAYFPPALIHCPMIFGIIWEVPVPFAAGIVINWDPSARCSKAVPRPILRLSAGMFQRADEPFLPLISKFARA